MTRAVGSSARPSAAKRSARRIWDSPQFANFAEEREFTGRLVDRVIPGIIESLLLARPAAPSETLAAALLADARRLTINLLTFVAAARQQQLPTGTIRRGVRLLERAVCPTGARSAKLANVDVLDEFFRRSATKSWRILAPRHAAAPRLSRRKSSRTSRISSDAGFSRALAEIFASQTNGGVPLPPAARVQEAFERGIPGFTPRVLGSLHEALLGHRLEFSSNRPRLIDDHNNRRESGSFYTPEPLVRLLVEKTIGPVLRRRLRAMVRVSRRTRPVEPRDLNNGFMLLDPAMGSGHFLTAALEYSTQQIILASEKYELPAGELARRLAISIPPKKLKSPVAALVHPEIDPSAVESAVKQVLLVHSIFGSDTDPDTVELARLSLWLTSGLPASRLKCLPENLSTGDSLLSQAAGKSLPQQFDAIIGNPPYGTPDRAYRLRLRKALPQTRHNADLAAAFVERSLELVKPQGQVGLVLPKPLTYSFAWRHLRQSLRRRILWICDVRRGWQQVLAEQVLLVYAGKTSSSDNYQVGTVSALRGQALPAIPNSWAERFGVLLSSLTIDDCRRLASMRFSAQSVGDLCRTFRGLPWQRRLGPAGELPVYGGRDLERWSIRSTSGFMEGLDHDKQLNIFAQPKLLFQNIIAHIERPEPHVRLIGTFDSHGVATLDTVNNLVARAAGVDLKAVLALLHSSTVNWLVYAVVYNRAIRTMHFDQYFLDKIPLPADWDRLAPRLADFADKCLAATAQLKGIPTIELESPGARTLVAKLATTQAEIDRITAHAYGDRGDPAAN